MRSRLPSLSPVRVSRRRIFVAMLAVAVLLVGMVSAACGSLSSAPAKPAESKPAEAAKPASQPQTTQSQPARPAPTAAAKPAEAAKPAAAAPAAKPAAPPAADAAAAGRSGESESRAGLAAPAPPRPVPPGPQPIVPPAPKPSEPAEPSAVAPMQPGRMVIFTTELSMLVASPAQLVNSLSDVVQRAGGYVAGVENKDEGGIPVTTIRLKLPPGQYDATMRQIRGLAVEVTNEKATTQDVTEEFSDVQTQLASLEASHARLLELVAKAQNVEEILKIQEKIAQTKLQIDRLKGRETFLQRSAELATVTVTARPAEDVLARTYSTLRSTLRRTEAQRAQTITAMQRARTPEEEATLRDRLGEVTLEIERLTVRIADIEGKAKAANITLPTPPQDDPTVAAATDQDLLNEYFRLVGEHRAAEVTVERLTREQRVNPTPEQRQQFTEALVKRQTLETQRKAVEERARRASIALPSLTADQIAALAGVPADSRVEAGPVALIVLVGLVLGGLAVLLVNRLRRRPPTAPHASAA